MIKTNKWSLNIAFILTFIKDVCEANVSLNIYNKMPYLSLVLKLLVYFSRQGHELTDVQNKSLRKTFLSYKLNQET